MSEVRDPRIKLFGRTIGHPCVSKGEDPPSSSDSVLEDRNFNGAADDHESGKNLANPKKIDSKEQDRAKSVTSVELGEPNNSTGVAMNEEDQSEEKTLKKPDKIVPCPRCNSMNTKFCYFNNYNVNQPRHFCKNCQRYWTAGGTMRNVPVGAGRRKNKHATVLHSLPNGAHHPVALNPNNAVLTFNADAPRCESITSVLNIHQPEGAEISTSHKIKENGDDDSSRCGSSISASNSKDEVGKAPVTNFQPFPVQVPVFPGGPWAYPFPIPWSSPVGPGNFPPPFPYWGCAIPSTWNIPWIIPSMQAPPNSDPITPTLGKHSRDEDCFITEDNKTRKQQSNPEKCLWAPKTMRIDDSGEAAKSSFWATLGINNDKAESIHGGHGLFRAFRSPLNGDEKTQHVIETSSVLQANPAALSRSLRFHESS